MQVFILSFLLYPVGIPQTCPNIAIPFLQFHLGSFGNRRSYFVGMDFGSK